MRFKLVLLDFRCSSMLFHVFGMVFKICPQLWEIFISLGCLEGLFESFVLKMVWIRSGVFLYSVFLIILQVSSVSSSSVFRMFVSAKSLVVCALNFVFRMFLIAFF